MSLFGVVTLAQCSRGVYRNLGVVAIVDVEVANMEFVGHGENTVDCLGCLYRVEAFARGSTSPINVTAPAIALTPICAAETVDTCRNDHVFLKLLVGFRFHRSISTVRVCPSTLIRHERVEHWSRVDTSGTKGLRPALWVTSPNNYGRQSATMKP